MRFIEKSQELFEPWQQYEIIVFEKKPSQQDLYIAQITSIHSADKLKQISIKKGFQKIFQPQKTQYQ